MEAQRRDLAGGVALECVTRLLQRARLEHPTAGIWEAADLQWWSRTPRPSDFVDQTFWFDADGVPVAACMLTDWGGVLGIDPLFVPSARTDVLDEVWTRTLQRTHEAVGSVEIVVSDHDDELLTRASEAGFVVTDSVSVHCWMEAGHRPPISPLADGYTLTDREQVAAEPHHMIMRSGPGVAARLAATSLYRADLDLAVRAPDGGTAAYALFWFDPVTRVGLVEPMRTEEPHQNRGLARHLLTVGLARLTALGAERLKISYLRDNPVSAGLYVSAGFTAESADTAYRREVG